MLLRALFHKHEHLFHSFLITLLLQSLKPAHIYSKVFYIKDSVNIVTNNTDLT